MQFVALIYDDPNAWGALSPGEQGDAYRRYLALAQEAGVLAGAELHSQESATTVRARDLQTLVTDGPYAEAKEALGGFYVFECATMDEALDWAARIPAAETGAVEVRAVSGGEQVPS